MKEAFENVEAMLNELAPLLLEAGIPAHQVKMPVGRKPEEIKIEQYASAFDWLHRLSISLQYDAVRKAKALRTEELWASYRAYGFKNLQEQVILEKAQDGLRRAWRQNRPSFFGRIYKDVEQNCNQKDSDGECIRPSEVRTNESDC